MSVIHLIKDKADIVAEIQKSGIALKKAGRHWKGLCPFHSESTPSFTVDPETQTFRCYGSCGAYGDVLDYYAQRHNVSLDDAIDHYCEKLGIERHKNPATKNWDKYYGLLNEAAQCYERAFKKAALAQDYLKGRGFTDDDITKWRIGFAPSTYKQPGALLKYLEKIGYARSMLREAGLVVRRDDQTWRDYFISRVMFPIQDVRGCVVGFGGRTLGNREAKYINSPESPLFKKSCLLYGLHLAKETIKAKREAIVVEGYTDVISAHRGGFPQTVGQMGTALTTEQIGLLRNARRIIMALDGDHAGRAAVQRALEHVGKLSADIFIARLPDGLDVDDAIQQEIFADLVESAIPATDYLIERTAFMLPDNASLVQRTEIAQKALPILMNLENDIVRRTSIQQLAQRFNLDAEALRGHAKIEVPIEDELPKKTTSWTAEDYTIVALLQDKDNLDKIQTLLATIDQPLDREDFPYLGHLFERINQRLDADTIAAELGFDVLPQNEEAFIITYEQLYRYVLQLRLRRIQRDIERGFENGDSIATLQKRKAIILKQIRVG